PALLTDSSTTHIYPLSLHDALPISPHAFIRIKQLTKPDQQIIVVHQQSPPLVGIERAAQLLEFGDLFRKLRELSQDDIFQRQQRSEEHTSELQSLAYLVCRLLLEKK